MGTIPGSSTCQRRRSAMSSSWPGPRPYLKRVGDVRWRRPRRGGTTAAPRSRPHRQALLVSGCCAENRSEVRWRPGVVGGRGNNGNVRRSFVFARAFAPCETELSHAFGAVFVRTRPNAAPSRQAGVTGSSPIPPILPQTGWLAVIGRGRFSCGLSRRGWVWSEGARPNGAAVPIRSTSSRPGPRQR